MSKSPQFILRRMYLRIQDLIEEQINERLNGIISGGKVPSGVVSGKSPGNGIGMLISKGDLLSFDAGVYVRIPIGFEGQVLTVVSGFPTWANSGAPSIDVGLLDDSSVDLVDSSSVLITSD